MGISIPRQIADRVRTQIAQGALKRGDVLPSERELTEALAVSRMTLRAATDELVRDGLVARVQGRGTVIIAPNGNHDASDGMPRLKTAAKVTGFMSFTQEVQSRGQVAESRVLTFEHRNAPPAITAQLGLPVGGSVIYLKRVRLADGEPVSLERCHLPFDQFRDLLKVDLASRSLHEVLQTQHGVTPSVADETVDAAAIDAEDAAVLDVQTGAPALRIQRITYDQLGRVIQTERTLFRADRYCMVFSRRR